MVCLFPSFILANIVQICGSDAEDFFKKLFN